MKYKLIGIAVCLFAVLFSFFASAAVSVDSARVHQHLSAAEKTPCTHADSVFCTHLPLVRITTGGRKIPGEPILDQNGSVIDFELSEDGQEMISVGIEIVDHETENNHLSDAAQLSSDALFRIRGNSSRQFDKKSYLIRLVDESGAERKEEIMGMAAHNEWALHGPFLDKTMLRNYMWLNICGEIFDYAPNVRFCEVFLDGEYNGVYVMTETVAAGEGRVNFASAKSKAVTSYIVRLDAYDKMEDIKKIRNFTYYTLNTEYRAGIGIVYPGKQNLTEYLRSYIEKDFSQFEKALYSYDFNDPDKGYRAYIDVDSFVDFYILMEFLCQNDMCSRSTYLSKDVRGKITMSPVWDFNNVLDNYIALEYDGAGLHFTERTWYKQLLMDKYFVDKVVKRYRQLRTTFLSDEYLLSYIDDCVSYLGDAVGRNYSVWGYSFLPEYQKRYNSLWPIERNPADYEEALEQMKQFIVTRGAWMDQHIDVLYQFCHESKIKQNLD